MGIWPDHGIFTHGPTRLGIRAKDPFTNIGRDAGVQIDAYDPSNGTTSTGDIYLTLP